MQNPTINWSWTRVVRKGSSSCSTRGIIRVTLVMNPVISHEWVRERPFNLKRGGYGFFLNKNILIPNVAEKHSDFGGKKNNDDDKRKLSDVMCNTDIQ